MTLTIEKEKFEILKSHLEQNSYSFEERPNQYFLARKLGWVVNLYHSGKIVLAGKDDAEKKNIQDFLMSIQAISATDEDKKYGEIKITGTRIGTDEVGKGDYFGPLVIAGVLADEVQLVNLIEIGIKDSKNFADTSIQIYASKIKKVILKNQYTIITITNINIPPQGLCPSQGTVPKIIPSLSFLFLMQTL